MTDHDVCANLREEIAKHNAAIRALREELQAYIGTPDIQEMDSEEIKAEIAQHREAIVELQMGLESQGC